MNQAGFPQQWIKQGYAEWDEDAGRPDEADLYAAYCIRNEGYFIEVIRSGDSRIVAYIAPGQLSLEGQERLEELFDKYAEWDPKSNEHLSEVDSHIVIQHHIPLQNLEDLMPQMVAIFQQHLEPWVRD